MILEQKVIVFEVLFPHSTFINKIENVDQGAGNYLLLKECILHIRSRKRFFFFFLSICFIPYICMNY